MVTVKMLKPYFIKADSKNVRVILAYQYFAMFINNYVYQFVPTEATEIRINRRTQKVANTDAKFAFQKGKEIIYIPMTELILLPDFLNQINSIAEPYFMRDDTQIDKNDDVEECTATIAELEELNLKRLIDKALDERDEQKFHALVKLL